MDQFNIVATLAGLARDFSISSEEKEVTNFIRLYTDECITGNRCFDNEIAGALPGISMGAEMLALSYRFSLSNLPALADAIQAYVSSSYLHYRALRCRFKKDENQDFYGVILDEFGLATTAAIFVGAEKEAIWLSKEYVRHLDGGYKCPYSIDESFLTFCHWLVGWYLGDRSNLEQYRARLGLYAPLLDAVRMPRDAADYLGSVLENRARYSYKRLVLEEEIEPTTYSRQFPALFPFELLAFQKIFEKKMGTQIPVRHPLIDCFSAIDMSSGLWEEDFVSAAEGRLERLEREVGIASVI